MKTNRALRGTGVVGSVLALLLVGSPITEAAAADPPAAPVCERQVVLEAWVTGGVNVRPAAEQALLGDKAAICAMLAELPRLTAQDDREQVGRIKAHGEAEVAAAANAALRSDDSGAVSKFLDGGWQSAREIDLRAGVNRMKAAGGPEVKAAANAVLRNGSREALGQFIESGWRLPYKLDLRAVVNRAMAEGGPQVQAAANRALQDGSLEMQERFVQIDWGVAQARDNENQTLNDLRASATEATRLAAFETVSAVAQADRAKAEAAAAKADAQDAERLASLAGQESAEAKRQARRAAEAADRAAVASSIAVQAARAAAQAARAAAGAAGRAATAAARAHTKSDEAWAAAAAAELDAKAAADAENHNRVMQQIGPQITAWLSPIDQITAVTQQAYAAVAAADSARANTAAAGRAAEAAGRYAGQASAEAKAAFAAAARAGASAERAKRATEETVRQADIAKDAAGKARDAATRAVTYAEQAASAAKSAAEHAGNAVNAAELATQHANNAYRAAEDALQAAETAQTVYKAARAADAERLKHELELELSFARHVSQKAAEARLGDARGFAAPMRRYHTPEIDALIAEAANPQADIATAARKAREVARYFATVPGTWTSSAAMAALGEDDDVRTVAFVKTGLAAAEEQDDRTTLTGLMPTGTPAMRAAAQQALDGAWADVVAFLDDPDYPELAAEQREQVGRILAEAREAGHAQTEEAANLALRSDDPGALQEFLDVKHNTAYTMDIRSKVGAIAGDASNGTEVRNGAQIALAGTTAMQAEFLEVERHRAAERDYATATHNYIATSLMIETSEIAQRAVDFARTAQAAAAEARGAAEEAIGYANAAGRAADQARTYATEAVAHARDAAASAERAAQAVRTAAAAAQQAQQSAGRASLSARWARASAVSAAQDAAGAYAAYDTAYAAQIRAGNSASEAARIAAEVFDHYREEAQRRLNTLKGEWLGHCKWGPEDGLPGYHDCSAYVEDILNDPKGPLHDPDGYAHANAEQCRRQFVGKALDACLSVVMSPLFSAAKTGISDRETETHRLAEEYISLTALDLFNAAQQYGMISDCKSAFKGALSGRVSSFSDCITGAFDLSEDPNWNENASQWKGTFVESLIPEELRFAEYNSIWGPMYLLHHMSDRTIIVATYESSLATSLVRMLPIGCVQEGGQCPYADAASKLRDVSESIKQLNNQGYIVDESGRVLDANGLPIASLPPADDLSKWANYTVESGLHDDLAALENRLDLLYRQQFGLPMAPPAWHLETQLAYRVATREVALRDSTLRLVMNNPGGVCDAVPLTGTGPDRQRQAVAGCIQAVKMLLPAGTTMIIYYPDPDDPAELLEITVRGVGRWLD
ncbi:DddA-like double-stranded DNA deaminase toxin [[Actinomadura] parvosata]|uniref:DddA-like double-stranded DNA deaminase toxin n=1 Tax=[Actinomadura] parvosata TaxID=1955412 RepID=UPI0012BD3175|nr:DddA-like double-stranded DNA deaminase toxin [Nonomuraea sp. ATCC 55076]